MSTPWAVAFVALWAVVILLAVVVLGLLRRIGAVLERTEATITAAARSVGGARPVTKIGSFEVRNVDRAIVSSSELFSTGSVVLFMSAGCEPCRKLASELTGVTDTIDGVPLYVLIEDSRVAREFPLPPRATVLYQVDSAASRAFANLVTPQAFAVDVGGEVIDVAVPASAQDIRRLASETRKGGVRAGSTEAEMVTS